MDKIDLVIGMLEEQGNPGAAHYVREVVRQRAELLEALERITDVARRVDGWESFPSDDIEFAEKAIANAERDE